MTSCVVQRDMPSSQWKRSTSGPPLQSVSHTTTRRSTPPPSPGLSATPPPHPPDSPTPPCLPPPRQTPGYPPGYPDPPCHLPCQSPPTHTPGTPSARSPRTKPLAGDVTVLSSYKTNTSRYYSGVVGLVTSEPARNKRHRCRTRSVNTAIPILLFSGCRSNKSHM